MDNVKVDMDNVKVDMDNVKVDMDNVKVDNDIRWIWIMSRLKNNINVVLYHGIVWKK